LQNPQHSFNKISADSLARGLLFCHLVLSPVSFWRGAADAFEGVKVALLLLTSIVAGALALYAWLTSPHCLTQPPSGRRWPGEPITWAILLFLISAMFSTMTSISPRTSWFGAFESDAGLVTVLGYSGLFFATRVLCRSYADGRPLLGASVIGAGLSATYALAQTAGLDPFRWEDRSQVGSFERPFGPLGHPNLLAAFLVMTLPLAFMLALRAVARRKWVCLGVLLIVGFASCAAIVASLSRGAWLGLGAVVIILGLSWIGRRPRVKTVLISTAALLSVSIIAGWAVLRNPNMTTSLSHRFQHLTEATSRLHIWRAGLEIFRDHPLFGCGLDAFQLAFPQYRTAAYWNVEWNATPAKAHNELIQVLATEGLVGGIAVFVLTTAIVFCGIRAYRRAPPKQRFLLLAMLASLGGFYVQGLVGFTTAGLGTLVITLAALLSRFGRQPISNTAVPASHVQPGTKVWVGAVRGGIGAAAVVLLLVAVVRPMQADRACQAGENLLEADALASVGQFEKAVAIEPGRDIYWVKLGTAAQIAMHATSDPVERNRFLLRSRQAFEKALVLVPANVYHHVNLGRILAEFALQGSASRGDVFREFDVALAVDPNNACFHTDAGNAALALGDLERARHYVAEGLEIDSHYGPLRALQGYLALLEGRTREASELLQDALAVDWHGDEKACDFARAIWIQAGRGK
jgi:O-antigen ligase